MVRNFSGAGNPFGIKLKSGGTLKALISDVTVSNSGLSGIVLTGPGIFTVVDSIISNNTFGISILTGTLRLSHSTITGNSTGFSIPAGTLAESAGNNVITDGVPVNLINVGTQ